MGRNITSILIAFIAGLAIVGFLTMLIKNPGSLLISILLMIGVAFVIFIIMRAVLNRVGPNSGGNSTEMKKYRKAVKQSNQKYNTQPKKVNKRSQKIKRAPKRKRKNVPYLKVIDGKKTSNKENEAGTKQASDK